MSQKIGIYRYERCGQDTFAKEVLEEIGNPERGPECVGRITVSEIVGENAVPDQPGDPAQENTCGNDGRMGRGRTLRFGCLF